MLYAWLSTEQVGLGSVFFSPYCPPAFPPVQITGQQDKCFLHIKSLLFFSRQTTEKYCNQTNVVLFKLWSPNC